MFGVTSVSAVIFLSRLLFLYCVFQALTRCNFCKHHYISVEPAVFAVHFRLMLGVTFICFINILLHYTALHSVLLASFNPPELATYPLSCPVGPMEVANMRLKSMGSLRSLFVTGDFMLYFLSVSPMSSLLMPSIWWQVKQHGQQWREQPQLQT